MRRILSVLLGAATLTVVLAAGAQAGDIIKIGEVNSYKRLPAFLNPYRNGWRMALDEINAAGGVRGHKLVVVSRDDNGKPGSAVKIAQELVSRDKVALLAGGFFSHIGLALADFAKRQKVLFIAGEPLADAIVWAKGNRYTFRLRPSTYMQASMLAEEAAKLKARRWATIAPNYAYGKDAVAAFKKVLGAKRPDIKWVNSQWPALFKIDAGSTVRALEQSKPDAIFNVLFGGDVLKFVREGKLRGLFNGRTVVGLLTGEPEYLDPMKAETPEGWIVTAYPWASINTPAHRKFVADYRKRYNDYPRTGSLVGYNLMLSIAAAIGKARNTDTESLVNAMEGLTIAKSPSGPFTFRKIDHQGTMGAWVGRTTLKDGKGVVVDWKYRDGKDYLPSDAEVSKLRPGN